MKKLLFALLLLPSALIGFDCYGVDECCIDECLEENQCFSFSGEWLYMMPSFDQSEYVWVGDSSPGGAAASSARLGELQRYYSAFRLDGRYLLPNACNELIVRYTNFRANPSLKYDFVRASPIFGMMDLARDANAAYTVTYNRDYSYYSINGLYGFHIPQICCLESILSCGVKFAHLHVNESTLFLAGGGMAGYGTVNNDMRAWALGPVLCFDAAYPLFLRCLAFTGRAQAGVLTCRTSTILAANNNGSIFSSTKNEPKFWHVIPTVDFRLGLKLDRVWDFGCLRFRTDLEGGYEMIREGRIINRIQTVNAGDDSGYSFNEWSDFTLNGPFVRFGLAY